MIMILVIALECVAIFANFAMPLLQQSQLRAQAAVIAREMGEVKNAAAQAYGGSGAWAKDQPEGIIPPELKPYLPAGFTFVHPHYRYDWNSWALGDHSILSPRPGALAGVTVDTDDPRLAAAVAARLPKGDLKLALEHRATLVLERKGY